LKILYLAPDIVPFPKGAAIRIQATVSALRALGHEVSLFTPRGSGAPLDGHDTVVLRDENPLARMLAFRRAAAEWLSDRRAEIVQFRSIWEGRSAVGFARRHGARTVFEVHGLPSIEIPYHYPAVSRAPRLIEKLIHEERRVVTAVDRLVVPSRTTALCLQRMGAAPKRIGVVPNAVDTDRFTPPLVPPPDTSPLRVIYIGTLAPWQGLEALLEALALVRSRTLVELHVVGPIKSAWRAALRRSARRLRVHRLLRISGPMEQIDLLPVLRTAHVCVAPLPGDPRNVLQGCCPIKIVEYMAAGRPILSTRIPPVEEILEHDVTARLVRPDSAVALADGLLWMIENPAEREKLGQRARDAAAASWNMSIFRDRLSAVVSSLTESE
jgi:glycosyltransferase involved in cell wall biosynthesis